MSQAMTPLGGRRQVVILAALAGPAGAAALWMLGTGGALVVPPFPVSLYAVFLLLVAAPVLEELAFRSAVQGISKTAIEMVRLPERAPLTYSNLVASLAFAAFHLPHQPAALAALILLPSLLLGRVREVTGSISVCILLHAWFNACFMMVFARWHV